MANGNPYVFGYGSLIWNPGFAYLSAGKALLRGAHRSLSVYSFRHRGTPDVPGLVFGLTRGGSCLGMAFEVEAARWPEVRTYLDERERDRGVYRASWRDVTMLDGTRVRALTYVVDEHHPQFAAGLSIAEQIALIRVGQGESGANTEYVRNTAQHLLSLGIRDRTLMEIVGALDADTPLIARSP